MHFITKALFCAHQYNYLRFCDERVRVTSYSRYAKNHIIETAAYSNFTYLGPHLISWRSDS